MEQDESHATTTRRGLLRGVVGASVLGGLSSAVSASTSSASEVSGEAATDAEAEASNTIRVESDGGGLAAYEFVAGGSLWADADARGDTISGNWAYGHVGPKRGVDTFHFTGGLDRLALAGPASVFVNGWRIDARNRWPPNDLTRHDFPGGRNRIRIDSDGGGIATYEFDVRGSVRQVDSGDEVWSGSVYGHVGPKRGTDTFDYTGRVTHFRLAGPATVYVNGYRL
ncbi:hypothetical protein [Halorussus lipolyticus]|uniref:hypothetical protein n=1 Tax=Halorussus lipolyticus TaxID=3034024 RepID=UPI0023E87531|nr:hypothetical protein [Halorussus sp. DT80]